MILYHGSNMDIERIDLTFRNGKSVAFPRKKAS